MLFKSRSPKGTLYFYLLEYTALQMHAGSN